jgi:hypothetical protein
VSQSTSARLCQLHKRLVLDTAIAFTGTFPGPITPTPSGSSWLKDYASYKYLWLTLEQSGLDPSQLLKERFGFITEDEYRLLVDLENLSSPIQP